MPNGRRSPWSTIPACLFVTATLFFADSVVHPSPAADAAAEARTINQQRALAIRVAEFGAESPVTAGAILASAQMAYETGQYDDARRLADRALQIQERGFG